MPSLSSISVVYSIVYFAASITLFSVSIYRFLHIVNRAPHRWYLWKLNSYPILLMISNVCYGLSMLMLMISIPFFLMIVNGLAHIVSMEANFFFLVSSLMFTAVEFITSLSLSERKIANKVHRNTFAIFSILLLMVSGWVVTKGIDIFSYPIEESVILDLPVKGRWLVGHAGGNELVNYHFVVNSQKYAIDIVKIDSTERFFNNNGNQLEDFMSYNQPVYSPCNGVVVDVVDSVPNTPVIFLPLPTKNPAGNYIVIEIQPGKYLLLAHFNAGSISVKKKDRLKKGDFLGRIGNSGNSSWPHLHMHIQDKENIFDGTANGLPFLFREFKRKRLFFWTLVQNEFLVRNDMFITFNK